jgi:ribosomal protein S18 acetylase RimI-like enzyme
MNFSIEGPFLKQSAVCVLILRALPEWFGVEKDILEYEQAIERLPTFLAMSAGNVLGFLSLMQHTPCSAEIYVMGVRREAHQAGIGRALIQAAEAHARGLGANYMQVKTLGPSSLDVHYAGTRLFYERMGYCPLEEFKQIWDEQNPCLILVKQLEA